MNGKFSKVKKALALLVGAIMLLGAMPLGALAADISPEAVVYERPEILAVRYNQVGKNYVYVDVLVYGNQVNDQPVMAYLYEVNEAGNVVGDSEVALAYAPINNYIAEIKLGVPDEVDTGEYLLVIAPNRAEMATGGTIYYVGVGDVNGFFEAVNMKDVEVSAVREKLDAHYEALSVVEFTEDGDGAIILPMTGDDYTALSEEGKNNFAELLLNGVNGKYSAGKGEYNETNSEDFVKEAYALAAYNADDMANKDVAEIVYKFESVIGFDAEDETLYGKIEEKDTLIKAAKTMLDEAESIDELAKVLEQAAAVQLVNETSYLAYLNLVNVVEAQNDLFGVDEDEISALNKSKKLRNAFCSYFKGTYYSVDEIRTAWDKAYKKAEDKLEDDSDSSGPSGPSGPSIKNDTVTNIVSTQITNSENNKDPNVIIFDLYTDMGTHLWASDAVLNLTNAGIVSGYGDKTFKPGNSVTRAEFMKMIVNVFSLADITATSSFADVDPTAWYYIYVASAEKLGIAQGYGNGLFGINDPITRQDALTIVYRAAKLKGISLDKFTAGVDSFTDKGEIAPYAVEAVGALYNTGVYLDATDTTRIDKFEPTKNASRAYLAVILNQIYNYTK